MKACVAIGGRSLVHPAGHPLAGQVVEFNLRVPGSYTLEFRVRPYYVRFAVDVDEDGRARVRPMDGDCKLPLRVRVTRVPLPASAAPAYWLAWMRLLGREDREDPGMQRTHGETP